MLHLDPANPHAFLAEEPRDDLILPPPQQFNWHVTLYTYLCHALSTYLFVP